jgi:hypothetical protein
MEDDTRRLIAQPLLSIVSDSAVPEYVANGVLEMIAGLGEAGQVVEAELLALRQRSPQLSDMIDTALTGIHSSASGEIFSRWLSQEEPDYLLLSDLAATGTAGKDAGAVVTGLLEHEDPRLRLTAARALGYIGYEPAVTPLIALLDDPSDPRIAWVAAEALGRLQATQALAALDKAAQQHWFIRVRKVAAEAARHIREQSPYAAPEDSRAFRFEFFAGTLVDEKQRECAPRLPLLEEPEGQTLHVSRSDGASKLKALSYASTYRDIGPAGENIVRAIMRVPDVALRVENGWLAASDRGEWGGELVFIHDDGSTQTIYHGNVQDLYRLGGRLVAVAGLAHMGTNHGEVLELARDAWGRWSAQIWRVLPYAPATSSLTQSGELLLTTVDNSLILLSPDGQMREAECAQ